MSYVSGESGMQNKCFFLITENQKIKTNNINSIFNVFKLEKNSTRKYRQP